MTVSDTGRTFTPSFTLKQEGERLSDTYKNSQGDNPESGIVNGAEVRLNSEITGQDDNKRAVTYVGVIAGDTMKCIKNPKTAG